MRRSHIIKMLDEIEEANGPVMADRTLAYLRKAFNWYATRDDQFNVPVVRGMARIKPKERARTRVLSDEEIRIIWPALGEAGTFGALVKALLLTAQRRDEVAHMSRKEIDEHGIWTIPGERYKTKKPNHVPLSKAALALIDGMPKLDDCDLVFPSQVKTPFSGLRQEQGRTRQSRTESAAEASEEGGKSRSAAELDPSRSAPNREDVDGSRWRSTGHF